jgi:hypothetical protein
VSRHRSSGAKGFAIKHLGGDDYRLSWVVDRYYPTSRLRHPRGCHRDTDEAGARRFAKKHGLEMPQVKAPAT